MAGFQARHPYMACPLCGCADFPECARGNCAGHKLYQPPLPDTIVWCRCAACGHVFTEGYFTDEAAAILLSRTWPYQRVGNEVESMRDNWARVVERVVARGPSDGPWLDLGFGNGSLLFTAAEWGYTPVGIDLRPENAAALAELGVESHCTDVAELEHNGRYSVISMADVLEHTPFPKTVLAAAHRLLRPQGVLFLSMPNSESIPWEILTAKGGNPYWGEIEHYHNFGRSRLYALLKECGFAPAHFGISDRYRLCMDVIALRG